MMKNLICILLIFLSVLSCKTAKTDYTQLDINTIQLYDFNNETISVENLTQQWNKRIQADDTINAQIVLLQIITMVDNKTNKKNLVLLGSTDKRAIKTATKLTAFENRLKLSDLTVTCNNCRKDVNIQLNDKNWICINDDKENSVCTKTVTLQKK
jgi:hypothetical protein